MKNKKKRLFAFLAFVLLAVMLASIAIHNISPHIASDSPVGDIQCALCVFGDKIFKVILPSIATITLILSATITVQKNKAPTDLSVMRSFPMLC